MIRKYYDMEFGSIGGSDDTISKSWNVVETTVIECECGTHLLQVQSDSEHYQHFDGSKQVVQSIYLMMFGYGNQKRGFWDRLSIAWKYLKTGKLYADQLTLDPEEAKKLADFINEQIEKQQH
jgi:hypothetical protein